MRDAVDASGISGPVDPLPVGVRLTTRRFGYTHHGIYIGAGKVVHYAGLSRVVGREPVEEVSLACFAAGRGVAIKAEPTARYSGEVAAGRARSRLGEDRYRLVTNNCEHFAAWCVHGESRSEQVERALALPRAVVAMFAWWGRAGRRAPVVDETSALEIDLVAA